MSFIAGQYTVTYNGVTIGQLESGINIIQQSIVEPIRGDNLAESDQDFAYQGGNVFAELQSLEYNAIGVAAAFWPYGSLGVVGLPGRLGQDLAKALVLTAVAGTPAAATPATLTASKAILRPGQDLRLLFSPKLRKVPLVLQLLPYTSGGNNVWFTTT